jgi:hypothetical protein
LISKPNFQWQVRIPKNIKAGEYILRHEIISLHQNGEPQNYPQCLNLKVTGGGKDEPKGMKATSLYSDYEDFNIYQKFTSYPIPGPPMIDGAEPMIEQEAVPNPSDDGNGDDTIFPDGSTGNGSGAGSGHGNSGGNANDKSGGGQGLGSGGESMPTSTTSTDLSIQTGTPSNTAADKSKVPTLGTPDVGAPKVTTPEGASPKNSSKVDVPVDSPEDPPKDVPEPASSAVVPPGVTSPESSETTPPKPTTSTGAGALPVDESSAVPPVAPVETGMPGVEGADPGVGGEKPCKNKNKNKKNKNGFHRGGKEFNGGHHAGTGGMGAGMWGHPRRVHPRGLPV